MLYFYLGLSSIAICILQGVIYGWFATNSDNTLHSIVDLWLKDPIEKSFFVPIQDDCPQGTREEYIFYKYDGRESLCVCENSPVDTYSTDDRYLKGTRPKPKPKPGSTTTTTTNTNTQPKQVAYECSTLQCLSGQDKVEKIDGISSTTLEYFFAGQKICISRIKGYSFAQKAPENKECGNNEKYCAWNSKNQGFDIDHGYCIPNDRECYNSGVQVPKQEQDILQLPLVEYDITTSNSEMYNIQNKMSFTEKQLLDINYIDYPVEQQMYLNDPYYFQSKYMPRVKARCRASLKDTLSNYIGPNGAKSVTLASMIISVFATLIQFFYAGIVDICDMTQCEKNGCQSYCEAKRVNTQHSKIKNTLLVFKPILLSTMLILNIVILKNYISMLNQMDHMIEDGCLEEYIPTAIGYGQYINSSYFNRNLNYACIGLIGANLLFDQNVYYLIKTCILIIFCKYNCKNQTKNETQKPTQTTPEITTQKESLKNYDDKQDNIQTQVEVLQPSVVINHQKVDIKYEQSQLFTVFIKKSETKNNSPNKSENKKQEPTTTQNNVWPYATKKQTLIKSHSLNSSISDLNENKQKTKKEQKNMNKSNLNIKIKDHFKQNNNKFEQIEKANINIEQTNEKQAAKLEKKINNVKSQNNGLKIIFAKQGSNSVSSSSYKDIYEKNKQEINQDQQKNIYFGGDSEKSINFHKQNTKEIVFPDAPAPPEQSEQLNNSILEDDIFSQK